MCARACGHTYSVSAGQSEGDGQSACCQSRQSGSGSRMTRTVEEDSYYSDPGSRDDGTPEHKHTKELYLKTLEERSVESAMGDGGGVSEVSQFQLRDALIM